MDARRRCFPPSPGCRRNSGRRTSRPIAAVLIAVFAASSAPASGGALCKPTVTFGPAHLSDMASAQRLWSARLNVDASRCASRAGSFAIDFIRLIEFGPDLPFTQRFAWRDGQVNVAVEFSANEAVLDYGLGDVSSCVCRE
jgi:hypothetical protein